MGSKSIAVIGAGPSGLVATKELLQEGHTVTCFEKTNSIGGVFKFRFEPDSVGVWQTCRLTSSILVTSFSDYFPNWKEPVPFEHRHMTHCEYLEYLGGYAHHFNLIKHIRLDCEVLEISPNDNGSWCLTIKDTKHDNEQILYFDAVAICSGIHCRPHVPDFPGLDRFGGQILHAANYKNPSSLHGKSAVFIGAGESGSEIIAEASKTLERSYLSLRRGVFVIPRFLNGWPNDYTGTRLLYSLPDFISRRSDPEAQRLKFRLTLALLPLSILRVVLIHGQRFFGSLLRGNNKPVDIRQKNIEAIIERLRAEAGGNQFETFATKTEAFVEALADGICELRPAIKEVTNSGVVFADGMEVQVDTIVLCTGYEKPSAPFLRPSVNLNRLYKNCFDPTYRETLAFIGFLRPPIGSIPPMSELQARWLAQLLSGNVQLPTTEEMHIQIAQELASREKYFQRVFRRLPHLVDYSTYMDELAEFIDCKPKLVDFILHPRLLYKLYTSAFCAVQYRFRGPHAHPDMATKVILHTHSHALIVRFLDLALAQLARLLGLTGFQPHLSLMGKIHNKAGEQKKGVGKTDKLADLAR